MLLGRAWEWVYYATVCGCTWVTGEGEGWSDKKGIWGVSHSEFIWLLLCTQDSLFLWVTTNHNPVMKKTYCTILYDIPPYFTILYDIPPYSMAVLLTSVHSWLHWAPHVEFPRAWFHHSSTEGWSSAAVWVHRIGGAQLPLPRPPPVLHFASVLLQIPCCVCCVGNETWRYHEHHKSWRSSPVALSNTQDNMHSLFSYTQHGWQHSMGDNRVDTL